MAQKHSLIRTIYLYLFALVGLALLVIGAVRFLDMGLKVFVFTKADDPEKIQRTYYYYNLPVAVDKIDALEESGELTEEEITALKNWVSDYKKWEEKEAKIDYLASKRQEEASINLALILAGLPLYFYHWRIIRKESQNA